MDRSGHWITDKKRAQIYAQSGRVCAYCGGRTHRVRDTTLDHVVPRCQGGSNAATNLVVACATCNARKGDMSLEAFLEVLAEDGMVMRRVRARIAAQLAYGAQLEKTYRHRAGSKSASRKRA